MLFRSHISDGFDNLTCRLCIQVVLAARRYGITIIETRFRKQAAASPFISKEPLQMYIVASALGWAELAKLAAINTLSSPLKNMIYTRNLNLITGADLYRLVSFRSRCADAACKVIKDSVNYMAYGPGKWVLNQYNGILSRHGPADELFEKLKSCPRGSTIKNAYGIEDKTLSQYSRYAPTLSGSELAGILECRRELEDAVEAAVGKVHFRICISQ